LDAQFLTVEQVSKILQLHPFTILKYIKQGKLNGVKLGRRYRIKKSDVEDFLERQGVTPTITPTKPKPSVQSKVEEKKEELFSIQKEERGQENNQGDNDHYIIQ
jgi:excisionase family DNA binding protein